MNQWEGCLVKKSLKVGSRAEVKIVLVQSEDQTSFEFGRYGESEISRGIIRLFKDSAPEVLYITLLHEVMHFACFDLAMDLEESSIQGVSIFLFLLLNQNGIDLSPLLEVDPGGLKNEDENFYILGRKIQIKLVDLSRVVENTRFCDHDTRRGVIRIFKSGDKGADIERLIRESFYFAQEDLDIEELTEENIKKTSFYIYQFFVSNGVNFDKWYDRYFSKKRGK